MAVHAVSRGALDEVAVRQEAARRSAEESIVRARAGREALEETLNDCLYHADRRARNRPSDDAEARVFERAQEAIQSREPAQLEAATHALCEHYATEIGGHFDPRRFALASWLAPGFLSLLLSATSLPRLLLEGLKREDLDTRLVIDGEVEPLSRLAQAGTLVCTPTHTSHMDSLVVGYVLQRVGLPRFIYGAGKNLFANPLLGFFLQHLGTYKVDRTAPRQAIARRHGGRPSRLRANSRWKNIAEDRGRCHHEKTDERHWTSAERTGDRPRADSGW